MMTGAGISMSWLDWSIVGALFAVLIGTLAICQRYVKSTADFLVANRCAGRYLLTITSAIAGIGAISIVANFEQYYVAGFCPTWWGFLQNPITMIMGITGWVYYRLRETRCMTMAQFFEVRYSRNFRVFSGICGWVSGVLNYGIFPAVSIKFFLFFCAIPETFRIPGIPFEFSSYVCLLAFAISMGVLFAIFGGQIAIMLTDFIQGMFCNIAFLILMVYLVFRFSWSQIFSAFVQYSATHPGQSLFNPYDTGGIKAFNFWFFIIGVILGILTNGTWQGASGYSGSARSAHEAKMAHFLGSWRALVQTSLLIFIPACAVTFFNHPDFAREAGIVNHILGQMHGTDLSQAKVPMFLSYMLPTGLVGLFAAVMFAAMLSTDDTYMHSWGTIFVQDVLLPFRKKPFTEKQHIRALRLSIIFVGLFAFFFSWLFKQTEYILLFFQITGAIFTGGAGAVLIGGLYSKSGSTLGAWVAMILGSGLALASIAVQQLWAGTLAPFLADRTQWQWVLDNMDVFPVNSQYLTFGITLIGYASYFIFSFLERKIRGQDVFNLDKMLHRGKYDTTGEHADTGWTPGRVWAALGLTREFTKSDRVLFFASILWTAIWFGAFIAGTVGELAFGWKPMAWLRLWQFYVMLGFILGIGTTVWFTVGGIVDIRKLFKTLASDVRNHEDDGRVVDGKNAGE